VTASGQKTPGAVDRHERGGETSNRCARFARRFLTRVPPAGWNRFLAENYRRNLYFCTLMTSTTKFDRYGIRERVELCN